MLPACRTPGELYDPPPFALTPDDVEGFVDELRRFHARFRQCFGRSEPRDHFFRYMMGQFSALERKSIEPIALQTQATSIRAMQRSLSDVAWDDAQMRQTYHYLVAEDLGELDGVVMVDETGFAKKGQDSVGVTRQYCGSLGKVANCQVGVFLGYASRQGYALVDKRLFIPEQWFRDDYAARRAKCSLPEDLTFQSKPQLAAAMVRDLYDEGALSFRAIVADCLYGNTQSSGRPVRHVSVRSPSFRFPKTHELGEPPWRPTPASTATEVSNGASAKSSGQLHRRAQWLNWRRSSGRERGIAAQWPKGPKDQSSMNSLVVGSPCARMANPPRPSG